MHKDSLLFSIAHISDLHFSKVNFGLSQFLSKRWIGNLNLILNRSRVYKNSRPFTLIEAFKKQHISHVFISGDLSTTSSKAEFQLATELLEELKKHSIQVFLIPGNHDTYTKSAYKNKLFYQYFEDVSEPSLGFNLKEHQVSASLLSKHWWLVKIDSTYPCPFYHSTGQYTTTINQNLRALLNKIPKEDHIILMNHFPLFQHESSRRIMHGAEMLRYTISLYPNIKLYLHGHTHRECVADLRGNHLPIIVDSGSVSHLKRGSYQRIEIYQNSCVIDTFIPDERHAWNSKKSQVYSWT
jgi:3',5'-cyclic AMP phosphodiesterase CpdA